MNPTTNQTPEPGPGAPPQTVAPGRHRPRRAGWLAAGLLAFLVLVATLFIRQAIVHQRVETDLVVAAAAFKTARGAGVREFAPANWLHATTRINEAMAELHRQGERFVLLRSYPRTRRLLIEAIEAAEVSKASAGAARLTHDGQGQKKSLRQPRGAGAPAAVRRRMHR